MCSVHLLNNGISSFSTSNVTSERLKNCQTNKQQFIWTLTPSLPTHSPCEWLAASPWQQGELSE